MSGLSKGEKWLARAMVPGFVGVAALCYLAWRPCEPRAQASDFKAPPVETTVPEVTVVADPIPVVSVEDLPKVPQGSRKVVAGVSRKSAPACTDQSPEWHCWNRKMLQGTVGNLDVQECDCDPSHY